jgi:hypothetical protein
MSLTTTPQPGETTLASPGCSLSPPAPRVGRTCFSGPSPYALGVGPALAGLRRVVPDTLVVVQQTDGLAVMTRLGELLNEAAAVGLEKPGMATDAGAFGLRPSPGPPTIDPLSAPLWTPSARRVNDAPQQLGPSRRSAVWPAPLA